MSRPISRRQTLGPLGNSNENIAPRHGNRRQSVDPSSAMAPKGRPPTRKSRASMIPRVGRENQVPPTPPSVSRPHNPRTSLGGDRRMSHLPPTNATRVDPRPVTDKAFQQDCIKVLFQFLMANGYDHPVTHKTLARPSGKDFTNIITFLLCRVDPTFQDGTMKLEDEIAMNFRALGYPFPISKTSLVAAGSPHTWPSLLAALTWLVERINYLGLVREQDLQMTTFESLEELESQTDKVFFEYLSASYSAFLSGDEQMTEELEVALAERFEKDDEIIEKEIEQMTDKNAVILEQVNDLARGETDLGDYISKRDGYVTDLGQFHDLLDQMDNHVDTMKQKKAEKTKELETANQSLQSTNTRIANLETKIRTQKLSLDDVEKIQTESKVVTESLDRLALSKDQKRKELSSLETEMEELWGNAESFKIRYNSTLVEIPPCVPNVPPKVAHMETNANSMSEVFGQEFESTLPSLLDLKSQVSKELTEHKWKYQEKLDTLERTEGQFSEALERLNIVENKVDHVEDTHEAEKSAHEAKLSVRIREAESLEQKIASVRDPVSLEEQMASYERQCAELEALQARHMEDNITLKRDVCMEIDRAKTAMKEHIVLCERKAQEVQDYLKNVTDSLDQRSLLDEASLR
eukprot:Nitzschia sp. Nitz4//scaffold253_size28098//339//2317//NITZ4_008136-RA/size28098-snap-gene-0.51-mRNA-1//-1//CDS//3329544285//44//frame0